MEFIKKLKSYILFSFNKFSSSFDNSKFKEIFDRNDFILSKIISKLFDVLISLFKYLLIFSS